MSPYEWGWDAEALGLVPALSLAYLVALRRFPASRARVAAFFAGQLLILAVFLTPVQTIALRYLLTMHLLQNVVLAEWAPALIVAGLSPALAARFARPQAVRVLTSPFVALPIWLAVYFAWHLPWPYDTALRHPGSLLHVEHVSYLLAGCLVWWPVLQDVPRVLSPAAKAVYLFVAFVLASPLGLLLALLRTPSTTSTSMRRSGCGGSRPRPTSSSRGSRWPRSRRSSSSPSSRFSSCASSATRSRCSSCGGPGKVEAVAPAQATSCSAPSPGAPIRLRFDQTLTQPPAIQVT